MNYATEVRKVVAFGSRPVELDPAMIDAIKERLNDGCVPPHPERLKMGQIVYIKGGPLRGLEAVFVREMKGRNRVLLLLSTLGLRAKLTMDINQISLPQAL